MSSHDWFERITGFREDGYTATQRRLLVEGDELVSTVNGKRYGIGNLTMPTLAELRSRVNPDRGQRSSVQVLIGDVRALHADPAYEGALFQVASQFNLLEMTSEHVTPEQGVARYAYDHTQGPACAMAAGAATIYRNYCVPVGDRIGQTSDRQLDALAGLGSALSDLVDLPVSGLWRMQNGYALCTREGLTRDHVPTGRSPRRPARPAARTVGHWFAPRRRGHRRARRAAQACLAGLLLGASGRLFVSTPT